MEKRVGEESGERKIRKAERRKVRENKDTVVVLELEVQKL